MQGTPHTCRLPNHTLTTRSPGLPITVSAKERKTHRMVCGQSHLMRCMNTSTLTFRMIPKSEMTFSTFCAQEKKSQRSLQPTMNLKSSTAWISVLRFRYSKNNTRMHLRKMSMWHWQSTFCGLTMSPAVCAQTLPVSGFGMWTSADTNSTARFSKMRCLRTVSLIPQSCASPTFPEQYSRTAKCNIFQPTN